MFWFLLIAMVATISCKQSPPKDKTSINVTIAEAHAIAREAYIYGFPLVDNYRIEYAYFVDSTNHEYKAPWNHLCNIARIYTPEDKTIQIPDPDTPYSMIGLDLRTEPIVITVPAINKDRYFSIQFIDACTHNFDYIGSRTTGNNGGNFLIAGPGWKGETPKDITKVIHSETELLLAIFRIQLFYPEDLGNVRKVQAGYKAQPLSAFLGQSAPKAAPSINFIKPLRVEAQKTSLEFFNILNFILQFCPTNSSETELMARFAKIGIGAGKTLYGSQLSPEMTIAIGQGVIDAWVDLSDLKKKMKAKEVTYGDLFGTREYLKNNYLYRMAAAVLGIYGNSKQEAMNSMYGEDSDGLKLDGSHRYNLSFASGELPPVNAFWSLTMYEMPSGLLVANPLNRYLINSTMLPTMKRNADGGLTLYIQNTSPGTSEKANWLPAPKGPFLLVLRLYWPKEEVTEGKWKAPPLKRVQ